MSGCLTGFDPSKTGWVTPAAGGGTVSEVTSPDGSITIVDGTGPTVQVTADAASVGADPVGTAAAAIVAHVGEPDPHTQYTTAAEAVAAVQAFREYGFDVYPVPLVVATPTPTLYRQVVTPVLAGGVYSVSLAARVIGSNGGTDIEVDVQVDGFSLGSILTEAVIAGGGFLLAATGPQNWAPGSHTIEYYVSQPGGPGSVTATLANTSWAREL